MIFHKPMTQIKTRLFDYYEKNEAKVDIAFFLGGFFFDIFTLSDIDDPLSIAQQVVYLLILGSILYYDFLDDNGLFKISPRLEKTWNYRQPILHFFLGSLLSVYSLFFLKSSSIFTSIVFVLLLLGLMIANELKTVQKSKIDIKIGLYVICVFSFFSMTVPVILGFVGILPFMISVVLTGAVLYGVYNLLLRRVQNNKLVFRRILAPGGGVLALFVLFYFVGWIPPVPLSIQNMGIYHMIGKSEGKYILSHENSSWFFWRSGDQVFTAEPGDKINFFAQVYSPARFSDSVILHWYYKDPRQGWMTTDKIPMGISGGRKQGYRGYSTKANYTSGEYRISVETTDGREIGRIYFDVTKVPVNNPDRVFKQEVF